MNKVHLTNSGAVCGAASVILGVAAIIVPKWVVLVLNSAEVKIYGLWTACSPVANTSEVQCMSYDQAGWIRVTSALEVAGVCSIFFALVLGALHTSVCKNCKTIGQISGPCAIIGGLGMTVGAIIWATLYKDEQDFAMGDLSAGFILAIVSAILSIIAGILLFLGWRAESREYSYTAF